MDKTERISVANEIVRQLGGNKFKVMTGAKHFTALDRGVTFDLPYPKTNRINIRLQEDDTYRLTVYQVRRGAGRIAIKVVEEVGGVYADKLQETFTDATGLETHL